MVWKWKLMVHVNGFFTLKLSTSPFQFRSHCPTLWILLWLLHHCFSVMVTIQAKRIVNKIKTESILLHWVSNMSEVACLCDWRWSGVPACCWSYCHIHGHQRSHSASALQELSCNEEYEPYISICLMNTNAVLLLTVAVCSDSGSTHGVTVKEEEAEEERELNNAALFLTETLSSNHYMHATIVTQHLMHHTMRSTQVWTA